MIKGSNEEKAIKAKIAEDTLAIRRGVLEGELATLKNEETENARSLQQKLAAVQRYVAQVAAIYTQGSKQYAEAKRSELQVENEIAQQKLQIERLKVQGSRETQAAILQDEQTVAQQQYERGAISYQRLIQLQRQYLAEKYALDMEAANEELALLDPQTAAYQQQLNRMQQMALQHNAQDEKLTLDLTKQQSQAWRSPPWHRGAAAPSTGRCARASLR